MQTSLSQNWSFVFTWWLPIRCKQYALQGSLVTCCSSICNRPLHAGHFHAKPILRESSWFFPCFYQKQNIKEMCILLFSWMLFISTPHSSGILGDINFSQNMGAPPSLKYCSSIKCIQIGNLGFFSALLHAQNNERHLRILISSVSTVTKWHNLFLEKRIQAVVHAQKMHKKLFYNIA